MNTDRRIRLWGLVVERAQGASVSVEHVCAALLGVAGVDSAAVTVVLAGLPRETVYATDRVAQALEGLALTLGEGPGVDAVAGDPSLVIDLRAAECLARWPVFASAAIQVGVRAVFALPLRIGGIRVGVMDLYRVQPGGLDHEQLADALVLADTACALLLDAGRQDLDYLDRGGIGPEWAGVQHPEVHQATGMVLVQMGVTAAAALTLLRAHAYAHDRRLRDVAADVVARRLRFDADADADADAARGGL